MPEDTTPSTSAPAQGTASAARGLDLKPATAPPAAPVSSPTAAPAAPTAEPEGDQVLLEPRWPTTTFEHGVEGADPITAGGTPVPASLVHEIEEAAFRCGIHIVQVLRDDVEEPVAHLFRRLVADVERHLP